jgi:PAS domain S-box-containing protein
VEKNQQRCWFYFLKDMGMFQNTGRIIYPVFQDLYNEMEIRSGIGSWLWNTGTGRFGFSPNFCRMTGIAAPEDLVDVYHIVHPDDQGLIGDTVNTMRAHRYIPEFEFRIVNGDQVRYIRQSGKKYTDENNQQYLYGFWQDITKQKEKEQTLLFHEQLTDVSVDGIIVLDKQLRIVLWNRQMEKMALLTRAQAAGRIIYDVLPALRNCVPVMEALSRARDGFASFVPANKHFCDNNDIESHYIPITDTIGNATAILCIQHDIAHRAKTEKELKDQNNATGTENRELKRRNAGLQVLAYSAGIDLAEPIRRIYTAIELMTRHGVSDIPEKERIQLRQIQASVQRVGLLADDMVSFSRLDTHIMEFETQDMDGILSAALKKLEAELVKAGALVKTEPLPEYHGHRKMLVQLFRNILSNAVKFRHADTVPEIKIDAEKVNGSTLRHAEADPGARYLMIRFADNGIGFDPKYNERVFRYRNGTYPGYEDRTDARRLYRGRKRARVRQYFFLFPERRHGTVKNLNSGKVSRTR